LSLFVLFAIVGGSGSVRGQESTTTAAQSAVDAWLSLVDGGSYAESWDAAATPFRNAITREKWEGAVRTVREPLGQLKSRRIRSTKSTTSLPGVPDGEYVVFQFDTTLAHKAAAVETVTAVREKDGTWHVGGYFIK